MKQSHKTILLWILLILMLVAIYQMFTSSGSKPDELDEAKFIALIEDPKTAGRIEEVLIQPTGNTAKYISKPFGFKKLVRNPRHRETGLAAAMTTPSPAEQAERSI